MNLHKGVLINLFQHTKRCDLITTLTTSKYINDIILRYIHYPWPKGLYFACKNGYTEYYKKWSNIANKRWDPRYHYYSAFKTACMNGFVEIVDCILQDQRVDPNDKYCTAIRWASEYGQLAVVKRLLQDSRVDPAIDKNYPIQLAAQEGYTKVVQRLLQDPRVDPSDDYNLALRWAVASKHGSVVQLLVQDSRVMEKNHFLSNNTLQYLPNK